MQFHNLKKNLKVILINFIFIVIILLIAELIFGNWFKNNNYNNLIIPRYGINLIDNPPYKSDKFGVYSRDKNGFRANSYELKDIDILVIGGSTTEERDIDDKLIWTKILEKKLSIKNPKKILNAGIGGQTSFGHNRLFDVWFSRFEDLRPQLILYYIGINDVLYMLESIENDNFIFDGRLINFINKDKLVHAEFYAQIIQYIKNNSAFHMGYLIIRGNLLSKKYNLNYNKKVNSLQSKYTSAIELGNNYHNNNVDYYLNLYENNLKDLVTKAKNLNSRPIFITQTTANDHWIYQYISKINDRTIKFCLENNIDHIDLARIINFNNKIDFYDGIHTTPKGSTKVAQLIFDNLSF